MSRPLNNVEGQIMGEYKETVLGLNKLEQALIVAVLMILGAVIGWFIPVIAEEHSSFQSFLSKK